jgi:hypothetical protein
LTTALTLFVLIIHTQNLASAETGIQVSEVEITHIFNELLGIHGKIKTLEPTDQVSITIALDDGSILAKEPLSPTSNGDVFYTHNLSQNPIRPFSNLTIWFEAASIDGSSTSSEKIPYFYDDNRFQWSTLEDKAFNVHWYQDDPTLGKEILEIAHKGLAQINDLFEAPQPEGIQIYAYASVVEMQDTLMFSGGATSWVAGHANPDSAVIIVSLPPGPEQIIETQRQIPHELVHILLFNKLGNGYQNIPRWLNEGLASSAELFPNPDFQLLLDKAFERDAIIPIGDLCTSFPLDAANFQLSYAEAYDFTGYLIKNFPSNNIEQLLENYSGGKDCEQGFFEVFEVSLPDLEANWRQDRFNEVKIEDNLRKTSPLLIVIGGVFIVPLGLIGIAINKARRRFK